MNPQTDLPGVPYARVTDARGVTAMAEPMPPRRRGDAPQALIHLDDGRSIIVPGPLLAEQPDGSFYLPYAFDDAQLVGEPVQRGAAAPPGQQQFVVPVVEERLEVGRQVRETGRVRIHKHVETRQVRVDEPVVRDEVFVERVPINQYVSAPLPVRYEGDTMILPVLEEVVVTEKRLVLREEVHVTRRQVQARSAQDVALRREAVEVERAGEGEGEGEGRTRVAADERGATTRRG